MAKKALPGVETLDEAPDPFTPDRISVLERRLQDPFGIPAAPVRLNDARLFPRWFNSSLKPDAIWVAKQNGWTGVTPGMVADLSQIGNFVTSPEGYIARGERAQEVLLCMPREHWNRLQLAKAKKNAELMRDTSKQSAQALEAAAQQMGGDAAERMAAVSRTMRVHDQYERIERTDEE